jgi:hypothetical protein
MKPLICGRLIVKFKQRPIEPFALGNESSVLLVEALDPTIDLGEPIGRLGIVTAAVYVAQSARALDVDTSPRTLEFQLSHIVIDHGLNELVPCQHAFASGLRSVAVPLGPSRIAWLIAIVRHGIRTARPLTRP